MIKKKEIDYKSWEEVGFMQRNDGVRFAFIDSVNDDSIEENVVLFFAGGMSWTMKTDEGKAIAYTLANSSELEFMGKLNEKESVELVSQLLNIEFVFYPNEDDDDCEFEDDDDNSEEH